MDSEQGLSIVRQAVADSLDLDLAEVKPSSRLFTDLAADSLDYLELVFSLEKSFGVKLARGEIDMISRLDLSDPEVMRDGRLTPAVLGRVREWLPAVDRLDPSGVTPEVLWALVTVESLWQAVEKKLGVP